MANRAYLYRLSNRPTAYADRPETISGLSEWAYRVPFAYRALMSGDPQLCASLISDGFDHEPPGRKTRLYAISSDFDTGFTRLKRFLTALRTLAAAPTNTSWRRLFGHKPIDRLPQLLEGMDDTLAFIENHRDRFLLLETVELDCMTHNEEAALRACVEHEIDLCRRVGAAIDALSADPVKAGLQLKDLAQRHAEPPSDAFYGLTLDERFDHKDMKYALGLSNWVDLLYFQLWNRAQFDAEQ